MSIKIALAGNPNCGKTTLFNALTGSNQFVGNWPGVTVEKKEGKWKNDKEVTITDLPGIYSLSPYTLEEVVARNYLIKEHPDAILNIVDGTNIERNLYLTTQLLEIGVPVVVAVNMMDIVEKNKDQINAEALADKLGCPVVTISALKETGIEAAAIKAVSLVRAKKEIVIKHEFLAGLEKYLQQIADSIKGKVPKEQERFYTVKLFERDGKMKDLFSQIPHIENVIQAAEEEMDDDAEGLVTTERYTYITSIIADCYVRNNKARHSVSDRIDQVVTNRFLALPIFAAVMFLVYYVSVSTVGAWFTDWVNEGIFGNGFIFFGIRIDGIPELLGGFLDRLGTAAWLKGLIVEGMVAGVGSVLGFVPQMLVLFLFLAFLESCGYMARIAFIMDRIFRKFGLSGKSFIPMLIGTGCSVPGIMASRTIENDQDRKMTIMTTSFIPCGAKLPMIALIAGALFHGAWWVAPSAYFIGIAAVLASGIILKKTKMFAGEASPFVLELPAYHMPTLTNVLRSMWERGWSFIKKAGTVILLTTIIIWFLSNFGFADGRFGMVEDLSDGFLAAIGNLFAWIFIPLGWGDWKAAVASIMGLFAKENVVGTLGILYGFAEVTGDGKEIWQNLAANYTSAAAYSFLIFNLLCAPCVAAMGAIKREMNNIKWFWFAIGYQTLLAYLTAFCVFQIGTFLAEGEISFGLAVAILIVLYVLYLLFYPNKGQKKMNKINMPVTR